MGIQINGQTDTISAVDNNFSLAGNVSVGGVLTYEDVTNVDAVGLSTFQAGIELDDSITHLGDTNTKIRFPANDTVTVETAGSERFRINSDGKLILSGTARTTPFISGDGGMCIEQSYDGNLTALTIRNKDTDAAAATSLAFSLNRSGGDYDFLGGEIKLVKDQEWTTTPSTVDGAMVFSTILNETTSERLRIDSIGNIILGYDGNSLHFQNGFNNSTARIQNGGGSNSSNLKFLVKNAGTEAEALRITSAGNIAIGTNTFTATASGRKIVEINGTSSALINLDVGGTRKGYYSHDGTDVYNYNTVSGAYIFGTDDTERVRITSDGEVLISNTGNRFLSLDRTNASTGSGEFNLNVESNSQATISYDDGANLVIGTSSSPRTQSGFSEKLRITNAGNVGINVTDPYYKLHLKTNNNATSLSGGGEGNWGSDGIRIENTNNTAGSMSLAHFRNYDADWHIGSKYVSNNNSDFIFSTEGNERLRINSAGIVKFAGISHARGYIDGGVVVGNSGYFDIASVYDGYVFVKILIEVGYTGNATYQMHAQYDYVTCNYYTTGSTATITGIAQIEAANAQFNYSDISITRPSNRTIRLTYAPSSGAGTHHPIITVSGVFDTLTTS